MGAKAKHAKAKTRQPDFKILEYMGFSSTSQIEKVVEVVCLCAPFLDYGLLTILNTIRGQNLIPNHSTIAVPRGMPT
jgi:hypothetical protein